MKRLLIALSIVLLSTSSVFAEEEAVVNEHEAPQGSYSPYAEDKFHKNVYFGDTHLHTSYSPDAGFLGNRKIDPTEAFR